MNKFITTLLILLLTTATGTLSAHHESLESVAKRITPVAQVYRTGDEIKQPQVAAIAVVDTTSGPRSAETIYKTCSACHASGAAGAPIVGNKDNWAPRISKGVEALLASALNGTAGGMPPKGMCMDCTKAEIKATVEYMISKSQ